MISLIIVNMCTEKLAAHTLVMYQTVQSSGIMHVLAGIQLPA